MLLDTYKTVIRIIAHNAYLTNTIEILLCILKLKDIIANKSYSLAFKAMCVSQLSISNQVVYIFVTNTFSH